MPQRRLQSGSWAERGTASGREGSDAWCSPPEIADPLHQFFHGPVDVDPCSNARSIIRARLAMTSGGLVMRWEVPRRPGDRTCYENDPYSQAAAWTAKMLLELRSGRVREHVRLCMMATSTQWWADGCMRPARNPRILALKRIAFLDPDAPRGGMKRESCRFEPALIYIGPRTEAFDNAFRHLTRWSTWGRS